MPVPIYMILMYYLTSQSPLCSIVCFISIEIKTYSPVYVQVYSITYIAK